MNKTMAQRHQVQHLNSILLLIDASQIVHSLYRCLEQTNQTLFSRMQSCYLICFYLCLSYRPNKVWHCLEKSQNTNAITETWWKQLNCLSSSSLFSPSSSSSSSPSLMTVTIMRHFYNSFFLFPHIEYTDQIKTELKQNEKQYLPRLLNFSL